MLTVVIKNDGEDNVVRLTYENLWKELKDIPDAELVVVDHWFDALPTKSKYICFVESDCLVNSGYFTSQIGLFKKNPYFRKLAVLSSSTGVNDWGNKFYGYSYGKQWSQSDKNGIKTENYFIEPNKQQKSSIVYPVQMAYIPGAIVRVNMLMNLLKTLDIGNSLENSLVEFSIRLSLGFWQQGDGNRVHINPSATYVTTEDYVNNLISKDIPLMPSGSLLEKFDKESI